MMRALNLKSVLQCELDLAIVRCRVRDRGASRHIHVDQRRPSRQSEIRMIENIKELRAELDLLRLPNLETLLQNEIEIHQTGASQISDRAIAKVMRGLLQISQRRCHECRLVDPAIQSLMPR